MELLFMSENCDCKKNWDSKCKPLKDGFIYPDFEDKSSVFINHINWEVYVYAISGELVKDNINLLENIESNYKGEYCYKQISLFLKDSIINRIEEENREYIAKDMSECFLTYLYWCYGNPYDMNNSLRKMFDRYNKFNNKYLRKSKSKYKITKIKARSSQTGLREYLINKYNKCQLSELKHKELLNVSHLKPFYICSDDEAYDEFNVLLLYVGYDKLLDKGYIAFDNDGKMIISSKLSDFDIEMLNLNKFNKLSLEEEHKKYIAWHRDNIFKK